MSDFKVDRRVSDGGQMADLKENWNDRLKVILHEGDDYLNLAAEPALLRAFEKPELAVVTGSRLYGTARYDETGACLSDTDIRAVVVPPWEYMTRLGSVFDNFDFEQQDGEDSEDHLFYSLDFFVRQLLDANPQFLEILFVPEGNIISATNVGRELLALKDAFLSKRFYHRLVGFAYSEFRKARGEKITIEKATRSEKEIWDTFRETFGPKWGLRRREIVDQIKELAFSCHEIKLIPSVDGISRKRRDEFERFGYCASSACHALRLLRQTAELLRTGTITFPRPDAVELRDIKMGKSSRDAFTALYEDAKADCEAAFKETKLPEDADEERIKKWYVERLALSFASDERFKNLSRLAYRWA
jgi:predicted nucleotidyltransferase